MFSYNLTQAIGWTVVHNIWQATAIALVCALILTFLRQKSANLRYVVASISLLLVLLSAIATFCNYYNVSQQTHFSFEPPAKETLAAQQDANPSVSHNIAPKTTEAAVNWGAIKSFCNRHLYVVVVTWCVGVGFFLLRLLGNIAYVIYLRKRLNIVVDEYWEGVLNSLCQRLKNVPKIELRESALVQSPLVIGYLKPMILFPIGIINQLNTNEVEAILAHELAHVMRHDYLLNILQNIVEALFYFHPAVWWLSSQIRAERENSCDDIAIQLCENSITYAKALVTVQEMAHTMPQLALAFAGNNKKTQLMLRVQRVLNQPKSKNIIMEKTVATAVVMLLLGYFAFAENKPQLDNCTTNQALSELTQTPQSIATKPKDYLTFVNLNDGIKDSIPSLQTINDGKYSFNDNTQSVDIVVKDKNVAQMTINGVEIGAKDFPKFEKMIEKIINAKDTPAYNNDETAMADLNGNIMYQADLDRLNAEQDFENAAQDRLNAEQDKLNADQDYRNAEVERALTEKAQKLQREIEKLSKKGLFNKNRSKLEQKTQELNQLGFQLRNGTLQQMEDWGDASDAESMPEIPEMPNTPFVFSSHFDDGNDAPWKSDIEDALRDCGAVKDDEPAHFSLSLNNMMVNEKSYPKDCIQKYIKIYERASGKKFNANTMLHLAINTDDNDDEVYSNRKKKSSNVSTSFSMSHSDGDEDKSDEIVAALIKDGFIKNKNHYSMSMNNTSLRVDGKKLDNDVFERYQKRFKLKKGTNITVSHDSDESK